MFYLRYSQPSASQSVNTYAQQQVTYSTTYIHPSAYSDSDSASKKSTSTAHTHKHSFNPDRQHTHHRTISLADSWWQWCACHRKYTKIPPHTLPYSKPIHFSNATFCRQLDDVRWVSKTAIYPNVIPRHGCGLSPKDGASASGASSIL